MPLYEYKCTKCYEVQEIFLQSTQDKVVYCPECGGACARIMSQTAPPRFSESVIDRVNKNWDSTPGLRGKKG